LLNGGFFALGGLSDDDDLAWAAGFALIGALVGAVIWFIAYGRSTPEPATAPDHDEQRR
jgi:hypothetical protein